MNLNLSFSCVFCFCFFFFFFFLDHGIPGTTSGFLHLVEMAELETTRMHQRNIDAKIVAANSPSPPVIVHVCFFFFSFFFLLKI